MSLITVVAVALPVLVWLPLGIAVVALASAAWGVERARRAQRAKEKARRAREEQRRAQEEARKLSPGQLYAHSHGRRTEMLPKQWVATLFFCGVGTYAWKQIVRDLTLLTRNGMERMVAMILIIENDGSKRDLCLAAIPPVFHDRLQFGYSEQYAGGFRNKPALYALKNIKRWARPLREATQTAIDRHFVRNHRLPTDVLFYIGEGGTMPCGIPVLKILTERFQEVLFTGFTALPIFTRLRNNLLVLKRIYDRLGLAGWIVQDNLAQRQPLIDTNGARLVAALCQAALVGDRSPAFNNVMSLILPEEPGGVIVYQSVSSHVTAHPIEPQPDEPPYHYVYQQQVHERVHTALDALDAGGGEWSVDIPVNKTKVVVDLAILSIQPEDVPTVADAVTAEREDDRTFNPQRTDTLFGREDYDTIWASLAEPLDASNPQAPITLIRLMSAESQPDLVEQIILPPAKRAKRGAAESDFDAVLSGLFNDAEPPARSEKEDAKKLVTKTKEKSNGTI